MADLETAVSEEEQVREQLRLEDLAALKRVKKAEVEELLERNRMLSDIALSAVALKLNIENGFPPHLHALNRDLAAFSARFGGIVSSGLKERKPSIERNKRTRG